MSKTLSPETPKLGDTRRNRRATTDRVVSDNRIFEVRVLVDGYGARRSPALYYRRRLADGRVYTGEVQR